MQGIRRIAKDPVQPWCPEAEITITRIPNIKKKTKHQTFNLFLKSCNEGDSSYVTEPGTSLLFYYENTQYKSYFPFPCS